MSCLDDLDDLLAACIHPTLWQEDRYYSDRAARLGASLSPGDWRQLLDRRPGRDLAWMERLVQTLGSTGGTEAVALLNSLQHDPEPSVAERVREELEEGRSATSRLQTLHLSNFHPHTYALSDDLAGQLDRAFAKVFPAADLLDRDRFPAWERVAIEGRADGCRWWLLRYSSRAMIGVDIDQEGRAVRWTRYSRARSRLLDRAYSMRFLRAQQRAVQAVLVVGGVPHPSVWAVLKPKFGLAWCNARWPGADHTWIELWTLPKAGLLLLEIGIDGRLCRLELAAGARAFDLLCEGARHNGEALDA